MTLLSAPKIAAGSRSRPALKKNKTKHDTFYSVELLTRVNC